MMMYCIFGVYIYVIQQVTGVGGDTEEEETMSLILPQNWFQPQRRILITLW